MWLGQTGLLGEVGPAALESDGAYLRMLGCPEGQAIEQAESS